MKVFFIFVLLTALTVGVVILMDLAQSIPFYDTAAVLSKLPLGLIGGQEGVLLFSYILLLIISHRRIMKNEKK